MKKKGNKKMSYTPCESVRRASACVECTCEGRGLTRSLWVLRKYALARGNLLPGPLVVGAMRQEIIDPYIFVYLLCSCSVVYGYYGMQFQDKWQHL